MKIGVMATAVALVCLVLPVVVQAGIDDGLLAYYSFNNCTAQDDTGNGWNGTVTGAPQCIDGVSGKGYDFNGTADYLATADVTHALPNGSVSMWFKADSWPQSSAPAGRWLWAATQYLQSDASHWDGMGLGTHPGISSSYELLFVNCNGTSGNAAKSGIVPQPGRWYHVVGSWGNEGVKVYVDGVLRGTAPYTGPQPSYTTHNIIGASSWPLSNFDGIIDEVRIYNRALTAADVQMLYDARPPDTTSGLLAYYSFNNCTPQDDSGNGWNGTVTGAPQCVDAASGKGYNFNGTTDYISSTDITHALANGSVSLWFKANSWPQSSSPNGRYLWSANKVEGGDGMNLGAHPGFFNDYQLLFGIYDINPGGGWKWAASGVVPQPGKWYHVVGVWGLDGIKIYVDGALKGTHSYTGAAPSYTAQNMISASSWPLSNCDGTVDEVRVYNRALKASEIALIYSQDSQPPTITNFRIPATSASATVNIDAFTASDNIKVTGYCLTETSDYKNCNWTPAAPVSYTFTGIPSGVATTKELYAWATDAVGNISKAVPASIILTLYSSAACSKPVDSIVIKADRCLEDGVQTYLSGDVAIALSATPASPVLKVSGGELLLNSQVKSLVSQPANNGKLYVVGVKDIGDMELGKEFNLSIAGDTLDASAKPLHISSDLANSFLFGFGADIYTLKVGGDFVSLSGRLALPLDVLELFSVQSRNKMFFKLTSVSLSQTEGVKVDGLEASISQLDFDFLPIAVKSLLVSVDDDKFHIEGSAEIQGIFPDFGLGGGFDLKNGKLDGLYAKFDLGQYSIPIDSSGLFLSEFAAWVTDLQGGHKLGGSASFFGGPEIPAMNDFTLACFNDIGVEIDFDSKVSAFGSAGLFCIEDSVYENGVFPLSEAKAEFDWQKKSFSGYSRFEVPFGVVKGGLDFAITSSSISGNVKGELCVPELLPWIGGSCLDGIEGIVNNTGVGGELYSMLAWFMEWRIANATSFSDTANYLHIGTNLEELVPQTAMLFPFMQLFVGAPDIPTIYIPAGLDKAIIRLKGNSGNSSDFSIIQPGGMVITPEYARANPDRFVYVKTARESWYGLKNPVPGSWSYVVFNPETLGSYAVSAFKSNVAPEITISAPMGKVSTSNSVEILYNAVDPDSNATMTFFYDTDTKGVNGIPISQGIQENDGPGIFTWDVANIPAGLYYVYAVIEDGKNAPIVRYSTGVVEVVHQTMLTQVSDVTATALANTINVNWTGQVTAEGYTVYLANDLSSVTYNSHYSVPATQTSYTIANLRPGATYRVAVTAFMRAGEESSLSEPVVVVVGDAPVPQLVLPTGKVEIGAVNLGENRSDSFNISNSGTADLVISSINVYGNSAKLISTSHAPLPLTIVPGGSSTISYTFVGSKQGRISADLTLRTNDPTATIKGVPFNGAVVSPHITGAQLIDFGAVEIGGRNLITSHLYNSGTSNLIISSSVLNSTGYRIVSDTCTNSPIQPNSQCVIGIEFTPPVLGEVRGELAISTNDPAVAVHRIALTGTGSDTIAPLSTMDTPLNGVSFVTALVNVSGTSSDTNGSGIRQVDVSTDGGNTWLLAQGTTLWHFLWDANSAGTFTILSRATDNAGNTEVVIHGVTVIVTMPDITAPTGSIVFQPADNYTRSTTVTLDFAANDPSGVSQMCISNTATCAYWENFVQGSRDWTLSSGDGLKTVNVWYRDSLGNTNSQPYSASITLDTMAPTLAISALESGKYTNNGTFNLAATAADNYGLKELTVNGTLVNPNADSTYSHAVPLAIGANTITTIATDLAGNPTTDTRSVHYDPTAPHLAITLPSDNSKTNKSFVDVIGTVDENASVSIKVNATTSEQAALDNNNFTYSANLILGSNTLEVTATDLAQNITTAKRTVVYDNLNPSLAITEPVQDTTTTQNSLALRGTVSDVLTNVTVSIAMEGQTFNPAVENGAFAQTLTFATPKTYAISVTATDEALNSISVQRNIIYAPQNWTDISTQAMVTKSGTLYDSVRAAYYVNFSLQNMGSAPLYGPVRLAIISSSIPIKTIPGVGLQPSGTSGSETYFELIPAGSSLAPGATLANQRVNFNFVRATLTFGTRVDQLR